MTVLVLQEVEQLFCGDGCPQPVSCEFGLQDCWYVEFIDEDAATSANLYLRSENITFRGRPVMVSARARVCACQRVVSESVDVVTCEPQAVFSTIDLRQYI